MIVKPHKSGPILGHCLLLLLVVIAIYFPSLSFQFSLDDFSHIVGNLELSTLGGIFRLAHEPMYPGNLYRPVTVLTIGLTKLLVGGSPLVLHLTNVALHAAVVVLICWYLSKFVSSDVAALIALIFAIHPIHTEVVANISNRTELLSNLFGMAALIICSSNASDTFSFKKACASFALLFLALGSKESAVVYILLIGISLWYRRQLQSTKAITALAGPIAALILYSVLRIYVLGGLGLGMKVIEPLDNPLIQTPQPSRLVNALALLGRYAQLVVLPYPLSADYSYRHLTGPSWLTLLSSPLQLSFLATLVLIFFIAVRGSSRSRFGFFATWFLASFAVTSNLFFTIGTIFGERLCYLPSLGIIGIFVLGITKLSSSLVKSSILIAIILLEVLSTSSHLGVWYDNDTLFSYQIEISPDSAKTQANYAATLSSRGEYVKAKEHFSRALAIYPPYVEAQYGLAKIALAEGKADEADKLLDKAIEIDGAYRPALSAKAQLKQLLGK